jgi:hypothetical protein
MLNDRTEWIIGFVSGVLLFGVLAVRGAEMLGR